MSRLLPFRLTRPLSKYQVRHITCIAMSKWSIETKFADIVRDSGYGLPLLASTRANGILRSHMELPKSRKLHHEYRNFCTTSELATKKCVPCNSKDMRPMAEELANALITKVPDWTVVNEGGKLKLSRSWKVKTFTKGLEFFQAIADVAEAEGHHPDLHLVGWNSVTIEIWTHSVGGLTENDFILAAKIDNLDLAHLIRIKPAK